jgi:hypothetical protein
MDSMLGENKNLRDPKRKSLTSYGAGTSSMPILSLSYNKTNKLITALYMVTDTMEKEEPIRLKLRTLGIEILSDINLSKPAFDTQKITAILSFLNIASDIRMISEMNCNILRKEFTELKESIQEFTTQNHLWFEEFISKSPLLDEEGAGGGNSKITTSSFGHSSSIRRREFSKGHPTKIGVQKGSTLMNALSKVEGGNEFGILKSKRREEIISIIKDKKNTSGINGASITDIKNGAKGTLVSCGEKTLQRELISMVKDNVLKKTGAKRWSQYYLV